MLKHIFITLVVLVFLFVMVWEGQPSTREQSENDSIPELDSSDGIKDKAESNILSEPKGAGSIQVPKPVEANRQALETLTGEQEVGTPPAVPLPESTKGGSPKGSPDAPVLPEPLLKEQENQLPESTQIICRPGTDLAGSEPDAVHFLLTGRKGSSSIDIILLVSLYEQSHACLTAISPDIAINFDGRDCRLGDLLYHGGTTNDLNKQVASLAGIKPRFQIELNLYGFVEMIDMLGGIEGTVIATDRPAGGEEILQVLQNKQYSRFEKQRSIVSLLVAARDVENTALGIQLLWTGYRNLRTDLGIADLLELRRVSQKISPTSIIYRELRASS